MVEAPAAGATELGGGGHWHGTRCHSHVIARDVCPGIVPGSSSGGWGMSRDTLQGQASPGDEALSLPLQTGHWKAGPRERRRAVNAHPQHIHGKKQTNKLCYLKTSGRGAANIQTPMPRSCGCHFHGDRHFANTMNLKIWTWGDNFGLHGWAQCNHTGPYEMETRGSKAPAEAEAGPRVPRLPGRLRGSTKLRRRLSRVPGRSSVRGLGAGFCPAQR